MKQIIQNYKTGGLQLAEVPRTAGWKRAHASFSLDSMLLPDPRFLVYLFTNGRYILEEQEIILPLIA